MFICRDQWKSQFDILICNCRILPIHLKTMNMRNSQLGSSHIGYLMSQSKYQWGSSSMREYSSYRMMQSYMVDSIMSCFDQFCSPSHKNCTWQSRCLSHIGKLSNHWDTTSSFKSQDLRRIQGSIGCIAWQSNQSKMQNCIIVCNLDSSYQIHSLICKSSNLIVKLRHSICRYRIEMGMPCISHLSCLSKKLSCSFCKSQLSNHKFEYRHS